MTGESPRSAGPVDDAAVQEIDEYPTPPRAPMATNTDSRRTKRLGVLPLVSLAGISLVLSISLVIVAVSVRGRPADAGAPGGQRDDIPRTTTAARQDHTPPTTATRARSVTDDVSTSGSCSPDLTGGWIGTWTSNGGRAEGGVTVRLNMSEDTIDGDVALTGDTPLDGGPLVGTISCDQVEFGMFNPTSDLSEAIEFTGMVHESGRVIDGEYTATYVLEDTVHIWDTGTFQIRSDA